TSTPASWSTRRQPSSWSARIRVWSSPTRVSQKSNVTARIVDIAASATLAHQARDRGLVRLAKLVDGRLEEAVEHHARPPGLSEAREGDAVLGGEERERLLALGRDADHGPRGRLAEQRHVRGKVSGDRDRDAVTPRDRRLREGDRQAAVAAVVAAGEQIVPGGRDQEPVQRSLRLQVE